MYIFVCNILQSHHQQYAGNDDRPGSPPGIFDGQNFIPVARVSKVMDGMFLGTQEASQDPDFLFTNKVLGIVNCAGSTVPNSLGQVSLQLPSFQKNPSLLYLPTPIF